MNSKLIIGLIAAAVVVAGGVWYMTKHPSTGGAGEETSGTFSDLAKRTGSWQCDISSAAGDTTATGSVFINDGKIRADLNATVDGREAKVHLIHADGFAYTWSDALPQGIKVPVTASGAAAGGQGIDPSTEVKYTCNPWTPDAAQFTVPTTVKFMTVGTAGPAGGYPLPQ